MVGIYISVPYSYTNGDVVSAAAAALRSAGSEPTCTKVLKRTLIAESGVFSYKIFLGVTLPPETECKLLRRGKAYPVYTGELEIPKSSRTDRPIVVGSGPAGLFCALILAEAGARPVVLERGDDVDTRIKKVRSFSSLGMLDTESNVQFGEGGAGTFSDGKLKPGKADAEKNKILTEFVAAGAPEEIMYVSNPHIGTDRLVSVVKRLRERIISLGGEVVFSAKVTDLLIKDGKTRGVRYEKGGVSLEMSSDSVVLATGHSARDVFDMLDRHKIPMEAKGFGVGVRIEHPQELINRLIYGESQPDGIESASYRLVTHLAGGRSVYNFCMCPGGEVVAAASEAGALVTNGGSEYKRDGRNANSAILVSVTPQDFGDNALGGIEFQRNIEKHAFSLAGGDYKAPAQMLGDFMNGKMSTSLGGVIPTYPRGVELIPAEEYLPDFVMSSLRTAVADFEEWMPGFYLPDAVLTGPETRTTSPVRVIRNNKLQSPAASGLYPCGEGAGYAGGIISSAADGIKCALAILGKFEPEVSHNN